MPDLFLPGPFAEPDMLAAILGPGADPLDLRPAEARNLALRIDPLGARMALTRTPGETAPGAVARKVPGETADRLRFALAAFGAWRSVLAATTAGPAEVMLAPPGEAPGGRWTRTPDPDWRAHLVEAAVEIMPFFGAREAGEIRGLLRGVSFRALARVRGPASAAPVRVRRGLTIAGIEAVGLERPYAKYFAVEEHRLRHPRFDGRMSPVVDRAVWASGDAVTILPFDPVRREVLLIEQFRPGPYARRDPCPWCLEPVAGRCDAGEDPEETARREAREEANLSLGRIARIGRYYSSPGTIAEHLTSYVGEADLSRAGGIHGLAAEEEDIRVIVLPLEAALGLLETGEVNNGPLLISLLWLRSEAGRLAGAWGQRP